MIDALPLLLAPEGYQISRSVRLRSSASAYFNRTFGTPTNQQKWTWSGWVKRGKLATYQYLFQGYSSSSNRAGFLFNGSDQFVYTGAVASLTSTAVFRDPSAWYHIVVAFDATQATAANRVILYVNGVSQTLSGTAPTQNANDFLNGAFTHYLGTGNESVSTFYYEDGYITEINFIDGQALTPSAFGETDVITGVWKPKKYAGTYGTNGFSLNFSDNSAATAAAIGKDYSGNGNNWTPNNISLTAGSTYDSMIDVPTMWADGGNGRGNYATLAPNAPATSTITEGNLRSTSSTTSVLTGISTISVDSGKWYWEVTATAVNTTNQYPFVGAYRGLPAALSSRPGGDVNGFSLRQSGAFYADAVQTQTISSFTTNDVIGVALDLTTLQVQYYKNGTLVLTQTGLTAGTYTPAGSEYNGSVSIFNFGQRPFSYTPPTGFKALNTLNLPEPLIKKGSSYFDATLWTGNGGASQSITNSGAMQPDLVWVKDRSVARNNNLLDSVRGPTAGLFSNLTNAEVTSGYLSSFNSNGFTVGNDISTNGNAETFVGWQWKEGATQGFDIVTYTGTGAARTVAHSLGVAPDMMIVRNRSNGTVNWRVYHKSIGATNFLSLNLTAASAAASSVWNNTAPTSSVFSVANDGGSNGSGENMIAYLFAEVAGFSKFGSYTGNGSADGPMVFTGHLPRFIIIKRTDSTSAWLMVDTVRQTYNVLGPYLTANASDAETTGTVVLDVLSNGFKMRSATTLNASGGTYIFAAFAESPFKFALAR